MSKFFMNKRNTLINDSIEGMILSSFWQNLIKIETHPLIRIIVRKEWKKDRVALISGGGSGHEPAHLGFIGKGMLTAAVCGDLFVSPSVDSVFNAILTVTGKPGCLLIVKNYTGDRLNFGLAAEKAKTLGYKVELVTVNDDISLPDNKQSRGIAGTALIHKIAGYFSEQGFSLEEITDLVRKAISETVSIGVAMTECHLPDQNNMQRTIVDGQVELGLGIHGEIGAEILFTTNSQEIITIMINKLSKYLFSYLDKGNKVAVLINNLGGMSLMEMNIITKEVLNSRFSKNIKYLIGPTSLVSSLDMKGFSLSFIILNKIREIALLSSVETANWKPAVLWKQICSKKIDAIFNFNKNYLIPSVNTVINKIINNITNSIEKLENDLNKLDRILGDGDTGTTFALGAKVISEINRSGKLPQNNISALFFVIGDQLSKVMGGSIGVLMSIFFISSGKKIEEGENFKKSLLEGLKQMKHYGGADIGDRTLIDALQPALEALAMDKTLDQVAEAAKNGADLTSNMKKANVGRSSYLKNFNLIGYKDPGAYAVEIIFSNLVLEKKNIFLNNLS